MDGVRKRRLYGANIHRVLQNYKTNALRSVRGPSESWPAPVEMANFLPPPHGILDLRKRYSSGDRRQVGQGHIRFQRQDMDRYTALRLALPVKHPPFFSAMDSSHCEKSETILEGELIACFIVGGEKRLCLPQILHSVLRDFSLLEIDEVCDSLHIFCSRCNDEQLQMLKMLRILPLSAQSCGLVTKTDAERLCHSLIYKNSVKSDYTMFETRKPSLNCFRVYHECFGKCTGVFHPDSYVSPDAKCVVCSQCSVAFSPSKFTCHSHKSLENRTCHWGFDSGNWRSYLMLAKSQEDTERLQEFLEHLKSRFDHDRTYKRRQSPTPERHKADHKRSKYEESSTVSRHNSASSTRSSTSSSAFRPWSPGSVAADAQLNADSNQQAIPTYLHTGPPVLLHPERVVRHTDNDRYERHFAPNVSLAPISTCLKDEEEEDNVEQRATPPQTSDISQTDVFSPTGSHQSLLSSPLSDKSPDSHQLTVSTLEQELDLVRQALIKGNMSGEDIELSEKSFHEFSLLRARHEEQWSQSLRTHAHLKKETEALQKENELLRKEVEESTLLHKQTLHELKKLQEETEKRSREEHEHKERLLMEIDVLQKDKEKCLKLRREDEHVVDNLQQEVLWYRQEVARLHLDNGLKTSHKNNNHVHTTPLLTKNTHLTNGHLLSPGYNTTSSKSPSKTPSPLHPSTGSNAVAMSLHPSTGLTVSNAVATSLHKSTGLLVSNAVATSLNSSPRLTVSNAIAASING